MMTSSNGNIFHITGHLCGNSPVTGEFTSQRPVTPSFDIFFDLRLNAHCDVYVMRLMVTAPQAIIGTPEMTIMQLWYYAPLLPSSQSHKNNQSPINE